MLDLLETRAEGEAEWHQQLSVRGYASRRGTWESWRVRSDDTVLRQAIGRPEGDVAVFESSAEDGVWRETVTRVDADSATVEVEWRAADASGFDLVSSTTLQRE